MAINKTAYGTHQCGECDGPIYRGEGYRAVPVEGQPLFRSCHKCEALRKYLRERNYVAGASQDGQLRLWIQEDRYGCRVLAICVDAEYVLPVAQHLFPDALVVQAMSFNNFSMEPVGVSAG